MKSNGVRLVSAKIVIIHDDTIGTIRTLASKVVSFDFMEFSVFIINIMVRIKIAIDTSYEIACAVER